MRFIGAVGLLRFALLFGVVALTARASTTCGLLLALQTAEAVPDFTQISPLVVRSALDALAKGHHGPDVLRALRSVQWSARDHMPRASWSVGSFYGQYGGPLKPPRLLLTFPAALQHTAVPLAVGMHEDVHARVRYLLPGLYEHEEALMENLAAHPDSPETATWIEELAALKHAHERIAMRAEWAIFRVLTRNERQALDTRITALSRRWLPGRDRRVLRTALESSSLSADAFIARQHAIGRYSMENCREWFRHELEEMREAARASRAAFSPLTTGP